MSFKFFVVDCRLKCMSSLSVLCLYTVLTVIFKHIFYYCKLLHTGDKEKLHKDFNHSGNLNTILKSHKLVK